MARFCLLITAAVCVLSACKTSPPTEWNVAATSQWLFAFDTDGKVLWKKPIPGMTVAARSSDYFLAVNTMSGLVFVGNSRNGNELWRRTFPGFSAVGWGFQPDSTGRMRVSLILESKDVIDYYTLDTETGTIVKHFTRLQEEPRPSAIGGACPVPRIQEEVVVASSSRNLLGYNADAKVRWKVALIENEGLKAVSANEVLSGGAKQVRVLDKFTGEVLWSHAYLDSIRSTSMGFDYVQLQLRDGTYQVMELRTGKPYSRKKASK